MKEPGVAAFRPLRRSMMRLLMAVDLRLRRRSPRGHGLDLVAERRAVPCRVARGSRLQRFLHRNRETRTRSLDLDLNSGETETLEKDLAGSFALQAPFILALQILLLTAWHALSTTSIGLGTQRVSFCLKLHEASSNIQQSLVSGDDFCGRLNVQAPVSEMQEADGVSEQIQAVVEVLGLMLSAPRVRIEILEVFRSRQRIAA
ncbi:uncharacterized protein A4U43_C05F35200 [Asparagus officinalis]|uniref:Uncharacterized protein n=1 Tax=Asparagus officinalis TaxID=4686 RepID=A0A5P1F2D2_ASPOF|nr:uncharacterized protein A4U43_C05F35200 [Asparagus officinalis]